MPKPTLGSIVGGKYRLVRPRGEGGMGTVYEAEHVLTHERAALKWVHPQGGCSETLHARIMREAQATSRIRHRHVVDVYDVLREGDAVCLVMELLEGEPLSERMGRSPMALHELIQLLLPAMAGLSAAHAAGVVHRDIKPENIFLARGADPQVVPKIIDFGISKLSGPAVPNLTHSGITMGTPRYVSYEQLLGARDVDARADVYSFAVLLYEAITGVPPYRARSFGEQAVAFAMTVPAPPRQLRPELPPALDDLVQRAMAKERSLRVGSIQEFMDALAPFADASTYGQPMPTRAARAGDGRSPSLADPGKTTAPAAPANALSVPVPPLPPRPAARRRAGLAIFLAIGAACLLGWRLGARRSESALPPARAAASSATKSAPVQAPPAAEKSAWSADGRTTSAPAPAPERATSRVHEATTQTPDLAAPPDAPGVSSSGSPRGPREGARTRELAAQRETRDVREQPAAEIRVAHEDKSSARPSAKVPPTSAFAFSAASERKQPDAVDEQRPSTAHRAGPLSRDEF